MPYCIFDEIAERGPQRKQVGANHHRLVGADELDALGVGQVVQEVIGEDVVRPTQRRAVQDVRLDDLDLLLVEQPVVAEGPGGARGQEGPPATQS